MQENARKLWVSGLAFLVLGTLVFFVTEHVPLKVELMPFSFMLIMVLVAGAILLGAGILSYLVDRF